MMNLLWSFLILPLFVLWLFATACLPHLENKESAPLWRKVLCTIGYWYDIVVDSTIGYVIFGFQWLGKFSTLTRRLKMNVQGEGYRGKLARFFCWIIEKIPGGKGHCDG